ncbi:SNF2-related protein [Ceratobasidium theobromae]|uniref:SNF2-related protein n=1 Tax=Ceratobasidium theobromae TaxID=1582974 RepID=A0A5N5Q6E1_9AGAM|nr:SNF2-related protein [Ceratobasidium theobromae]
MPLGTLATCLLPLLAAVPSDAVDPFEHPPFTFSIFRANMRLLPLSVDEEPHPYEDELPDVGNDSASKLHAAARDGFKFSQDALKGLTQAQIATLSDASLVQANHFYHSWLWAEVKRQRALGYSIQDAVKRIDLVGTKTVLKDGRTDGGWKAYRLLILTLLNRSGGIMDITEDAMVSHRATPAERWRDARDENRRKVDGHPLSEYDVPIPSAGPFTSSLALLDEVAELVFGPEVVNDRGSVDTVYRDCCKVLVNRVWEQMARKLKTNIKKSKKLSAELGGFMAGASYFKLESSNLGF